MTQPMRSVLAVGPASSTGHCLVKRWGAGTDSQKSGQFCHSSCRRSLETVNRGCDFEQGMDGFFLALVLASAQSSKPVKIADLSGPVGPML